MRTNVRDVSIEAFRGISITKRQAEIVSFLSRYPNRDWTRKELATMAGIEINCVCGRVNELIASGVLEERVRRACKFTGKQAHPIRLAPRQTVLSLEAA